MLEVLLVSKPVAPPWQDGGKNVVRDVAVHTRRVRPHVLTSPGVRLGADHVVEEPIFPAAGSFAPSSGQHLRVLLRLLRPDRIPVWHFFYAPNPRTSSAARAILRLKRRKTVQTVSSVPRDFGAVRDLIFADRVLTLSAWTAARLGEAGVPGAVHVPPMVAPAEPDMTARRARVRADLALPPGVPLVVFPGDLEFGEAGSVVADAARADAAGDACWVFACREKTALAKDHARRLRETLRDRIAAGRAAFVGQVADPRALFAEASVVVLPASSTYAKTDLPFAVLEAMAEGTPVVVADADPVRECLGTADRRPDEAPGLVVPPHDPRALAAAVADLLRDDRARASMGAAARRWTGTAFGGAALGDAHADIYEDLVRRDGTRA